MEKFPSDNYEFLSLIRATVRIAVIILIVLTGFGVFLFSDLPLKLQALKETTPPATSGTWQAPDTASIPHNETGNLIRYGRELIVNTAYYLGPNGTVMKMSNGMTCQNCHLEAGTKLFGNNFSATASTYPKYRARYGAMGSVERRVNECFERSLNGTKLDSMSHEMRAIIAYIGWVGKDVKKGESPVGSGVVNIAFLDRAASPVNGKLIYSEHCASCHGGMGEGLKKNDSTWQNPPLWGDDSYNIGAGIYRLTRLAAFVKGNMPFEATAEAPLLSDEEAWDVAAYINSMPHPEMNLTRDWPKILEKPSDYPFGPFADSFSEEQHKYGPFLPIQEELKKLAEDRSAKKKKTLP